MRPDRRVRPEYLAAFSEMTARIAKTLVALPPSQLPIRMFVAGGAALYLHTGTRVSTDVDAAFSRRLVLPEDLDVVYRDADGAARILYFDHQYNDTFALMHEDAQADAVPLLLPGLNPRILEVRLLTPLDLALSKVSRFADIDRADIETLARHGLIQTKTFRQRAEAALAGYVGELTRVRGSIEIACRLIDDAARTRQTQGR